MKLDFNHQSDRREMLATIPMAAAALAHPINSPQSGVETDRAKWDRGKAQLARLDDARLALETQIDEIAQGYIDQMPSSKSIDWGTEFSFLNKAALAERLDLEADMQDLMRSHCRTWWGNLEARLERRRALHDQIRNYRARKAEHEHKFPIAAMFNELGELDALKRDLLATMLSIPAPDAEALCWKVQTLFDATANSNPDRFDEIEELPQQILLDVRQLGRWPSTTGHA